MLGGRKLAFSSLLLILFTMTLAIIPATTLQFCGNDLSNALAIVCSETGYNMPPQFRSDTIDSNGDRRYPRETGERHKRGIVDECCRASCGWATIETYCRPQPSSTSSENLQIQKRSDPPSDVSFREQVEGYAMTHSAEQSEGLRHQRRRLFSQSEDAVVIKNSRMFHSDKRRSDITLTSNKVKRNDEANKAEELKHDKFKVEKVQYLQIRHHRVNKFYHKDLKRGKSAQVGTVSPYYFGKFLVSPRARKLPF